MLDPKASRFYGAALQSGLVDEADLAACWELIPPEKRTPDAIDRRLARQAITTGRLTLWQAQQLISGRSTGYRIDKYILLDLLGRGGMGRVFLAKDIRLNRRVALKILSQERINNPRAIARFQREAKVGAQLQHENLVRVYDEGESGGVRYLVMEYIEGKNVGQLVTEQGKIPWPNAARLARQIALGLEHAQQKGLIHRDVNPSNILVTTDGTAKLTDLGLAIDLADQDNVTRDGATVGTFDYVSPEQARHSRSVDTRADVYSLGCTLYQMIAGRVPFPVASLPEKLYAHQLHEPDPLTDLVPDVPEGLAEVVRKMMRKLPEDRYQTPLEAAQALEPYAIETGWTTTPAALAPSSASSTTQNRPVLADPVASSQPAAANPPGSWAPSLNLDPALGAIAVGSSPGTAPTPTGSNSSTGVSVGDSFFPLDLGPDEPLTGGLKAASKGAKATAKVRTPNPDRPPFPIGKVGRIAAGVVAALVGLAAIGALGVLVWSRSGAPVSPDKDRSKGDKVAKSSKMLDRGDIVVLYRDGDSKAVKTLPDAIAMAVRDRAEVILAGGSTVRLDNARTIRLPEGGLTLRAADGTRATLEIVIKAPQSMFVVNAGLRIVGLTVVVRYETSTDEPVFRAEREMAMERCTFRALGTAEKSRLILAEGRKLDATGCLFEGFETALDAAAPPGMAITLKQSIILAAKPGDDLAGRAIRVRSFFGQGAASRLVVNRCSARAGAFLDAGKFSTASALEVRADASAFLVKALVAFEGDEKAPVGPESAVQWFGKDNRFQINSGGWVTQTNLEKLAGGPADLEAWSKLTRGEIGSLAAPLKLAKEPPDPATPKDCALILEDGKPAGADPSQVGPG